MRTALFCDKTAKLADDAFLLIDRAIDWSIVLQPCPALSWTQRLVGTSSWAGLQRLPLSCVSSVLLPACYRKSSVVSVPRGLLSQYLKVKLDHKSQLVLTLLRDWARACSPPFREDFIYPETSLCCNCALIVNSSQGPRDGSFRTDKTQRQGRDVGWLFLEHLNPRILTMSISVLPNGWLFLD